MKKKISNIIKTQSFSIMENNLYKNIILISISLFLVEIIFRLVSNLQIINWSLFRILISNTIISFLLGIILSFAKNIIQKIVMLTITTIVSIYAILQAGFLNFLGVYISFGTSSQLGAVKEYISDYIASFRWYYLTLLLPIFIMVLYYIFIDKKFNSKEKINNKKLETKRRQIKIARIAFSIYTIILIFIYSMSLSTSFMQDKLQAVSNEALFENPTIPNIAVKEFGVLAYGLIDIKSTIIPVANANEEITYEKPKEDPQTNYSRIIDDANWLELNNNETNKDYKNLNNYFLSQSITPKNEYTGIFEGKNLIVIMMESVNNLIINEEYFPNIYNLYENGWSWENAFSPRNSCSTGNNEMSAVTSLYTINNRCTANAYRTNTYYNSIYNLFNNAGYYSSSYHNFNDKYYYRNQVHPNFGSQSYMDARKLGISLSPEYGEWPSDIELMEKSIDKYITQDNFFSFIISVTSHNPYGTSSTYGDLYAKDYRKYTSNREIQRYMSKMKVLDEAIGYLVQELKNANKLNDTVILLYSDHYPYAISLNELQTTFDIPLDERRNIDRTPFIIYNPNIKATKFSEYTTFMNILPTIANLFNLEYDPRLYFGNDLLDGNYPDYAIFSDGSWVDSNAYYNASNGKIAYLDDNYKYDSEYIIERNKEINNKIRMSNLAIEKNYFAYLEKQLGLTGN